MGSPDEATLEEWREAFRRANQQRMADVEALQALAAYLKGK